MCISLIYSLTYVGMFLPFHFLTLLVLNKFVLVTHLVSQRVQNLMISVLIRLVINIKINVTCLWTYSSKQKNYGKISQSFNLMIGVQFLSFQMYISREDASVTYFYLFLLQLFRINEANQLMQYDQCLTKGADGSKVMITHCNLNEFKEWQYFKVFCI